MNKIKPGDTAEIIDSGATFAGYIKMAESVGANRWVQGRTFNKGTLGVVEGIYPHLHYPLSHSEIALFREEGGEQALIGVDGLRFVSSDWDE